MGFIWFIGEYFEHLSAASRLAIFSIVTILVTLSFHWINKWLADRERKGIIAFILSVLFPGSGFAYTASYIKGWITAILSVVLLNYAIINEYDPAGYAFVVINLVQLFWAPANALDASHKLRLKKYKNIQKSIEDTYFQGLMYYINAGYHVAVDTNFLMHFGPVLLDIYKKTNVHLFLHPTVFAELEGLKGNRNREVRRLAQSAFDILEMYQKNNRMQWTRRQKHGSNFKSSDQRIITGVLNEIQSGVKLVFASHDKGARILARSLQIPVVDPNENYNYREKIKAE